MMMDPRWAVAPALRPKIPSSMVVLAMAMPVSQSAWAPQVM